MTNTEEDTASIVYRGPVKRRWFRRWSYTHNGHEIDPPWHYGVERRQIEIPQEDRTYPRILGSVTALCGYEYTWDYYIGLAHGNADYRDEVKTKKRRCKKCDATLAKVTEDHCLMTAYHPPHIWGESKTRLCTGYPHSE